MTETTYGEVRRALDDARLARNSRQNDGKWPAWIQTAIAVGVVVVSLAMAYGALDKRISLLEQKLDFISQQVSKR